MSYRSCKGSTSKAQIPRWQSNKYLLHQHENDYNKRNKTGGMTYDDA